MASKSVSAVALILVSLNLLFFSMVSSNPLMTPSLVSSIISNKKCPELHVCATILPPHHKPDKGCCPLIAGLIDLEAAVCLCAVLKLDLGGIISIPLDIFVNLLLNMCGRKSTTYTCN
ncbi:hypothetical protein JHK82_023716 [Glycine max]|nr:hypothetical protein JHK82_023716 [Glycine max]